MAIDETYRGLDGHVACAAGRAGRAPWLAEAALHAPGETGGRAMATRQDRAGGRAGAGARAPGAAPRAGAPGPRPQPR
jgi:hypothetical protein